MTTTNRRIDGSRIPGGWRRPTTRQIARDFAADAARAEVQRLEEEARQDRLASHRDDVAFQDRMTLTLVEIAELARKVITAADADGLTIDDGNVIDLLADNIEHVPLETLRDALVVAGYSARFPRATSRNR